jgi:DNA-directed RNA polymerase specialized sigma24 family protein
VDSVERLATADESGGHPQQFSDPAALDAFKQAELEVDMVALLATLDLEQRAVLYDAYWRDTPRVEIADKLGITDRALRMRMEKLLTTLRARMTSWGGSQ